MSECYLIEGFGDTLFMDVVYSTSIEQAINKFRETYPKAKIQRVVFIK